MQTTSPPDSPAPASGPLLTRAPWLWTGESKDTFLKYWRQGHRPNPVDTGSLRPMWRVADVVAWVESRPVISPNAVSITA